MMTSEVLPQINLSMEGSGSNEADGDDMSFFLLLMMMMILFTPLVAEIPQRVVSSLDWGSMFPTAQVPCLNASNF